DLFVCRFVEFDKSKNKFCGNEDTGERYYCIPRVYPPARSWLFHNNGDDTFPNFLFRNRNGKFEDIGLEAGVAYSLDGRARSGMGVDSADLNQDGWQDLFVANVDQEMYSVYRNNHD